MQNKTIESGIQLFSRIIQRPKLDYLNDKLFPEGGPYSNQLIELTGESGAGKTILLTDFLVRCLLPVEYNGKNSGAVIIDTDHHFDVFRLVSIIEYYLKKSDVKSNNYQTIIEHCLNNLIVLSCYSSEQLQATFLNLETVILQNANISFLAIDSVSAYYWSERINNDTISFNAYFSQIIGTLKNIAKSFNLTVLYTKPEIQKEPLYKRDDYKICLSKHEKDICKADVTNFDNVNISCKYKIHTTIEFSS